MKSAIKKRVKRSSGEKNMLSEVKVNGMEVGTGGSRFQQGVQYQHNQPRCDSSSGRGYSRFQNLLESVANSQVSDSSDVDLILSQDFFCTPDYITPDNQNLLNKFDCYKEGMPCPKSPERLNTSKLKKLRHNNVVNPLSPTISDQPVMGLSQDDLCENEVESETVPDSNLLGFVPKSAVALRCRVIPPPCIRNPYLNEVSDQNVDPFDCWRSKCAGFLPQFVGGEGLSRYHADFHEIQQIGAGNFSRVFKVLKRIDGCLYAVKQSTRALNQEIERRKVLMEIQALAALGFHENIVAYYSSWFENEQFYIQMELCDYSLSIKQSTVSITEEKALKVLYQIGMALQFIHGKGIAHLDVKPDNIYTKNGNFKLGDFGCATLLDQSLPIEEGDARYMPQEILNEHYDHLDKTDIFSLGVSIFEIIRGSPLFEVGFKSLNLREGKLPLLPGHSLQLQHVLKTMVDPDPAKRPSAKQLLENRIFEKLKSKR